MSHTPRKPLTIRFFWCITRLWACKFLLFGFLDGVGRCGVRGVLGEPEIGSSDAQWSQLRFERLSWVHSHSSLGWADLCIPCVEERTHSKKPDWQEFLLLFCSFTLLKSICVLMIVAQILVVAQWCGVTVWWWEILLVFIIHKKSWLE